MEQLRDLCLTNSIGINGNMVDKETAAVPHGLSDNGYHGIPSIVVRCLFNLLLLIKKLSTSLHNWMS